MIQRLVLTVFWNYVMPFISYTYCRPVIYMTYYNSVYVHIIIYITYAHTHINTPVKNMYSLFILKGWRV